MQAEIENGNGRIYPIEVLAREVERYSKLVAEGRALGELKHPAASPTIDYDRASHRFISLEQDGNNIVGKALILEGTPCGDLVRGLIKGGVKLGVSSRGMGTTVVKNGKTYVNEDFRLITPADIVYNPSAPEAFVDAMMEDADWIYEAGKWVPQFDRFIEENKEKIKTASKYDLLSDKLPKQLMEDYFKKLSKTYIR